MLVIQAWTYLEHLRVYSNAKVCISVSCVEDSPSFNTLPLFYEFSSKTLFSDFVIKVKTLQYTPKKCKASLYPVRLDSINCLRVMYDSALVAYQSVESPRSLLYFEFIL